MRRLRIFVPHASDRLTDTAAHGDGLIAYEVASRLARRGHDVVVAAPRIEVTGVVPPGLRLESLGARDDRTSLGRLRYMVAVRRFFEREDRLARFDLIHQLNPVFTGISLSLADKGRPTVLGSYVGHWPAELGARPSAAKHFFRDVLAREQQRHADALLLSTPAAIERVVDRKRDGAKIRIVPHGIDPALYDDVAAGEPEGGAPAIVYVGSLERRKGIDILVRAFDSVAARVPAVRLRIAGDGSLRDEIAALASASPFRDRITMLGRVSREALPHLLGDASVVCVPSVHEPFGMSLLEAMAAARPVVVTDAGGPRDLVDDEGGIRVAYGDVAGVADALVNVLTSPHRRDMGLHNRALVLEKYSWDPVIDALEGVYDGVLSGSKRRS